MATSRTKKVTDEERNTPPTLTTVPASLAEAADEAHARAWFEDKVVRSVRDAGHCTEALRIMDNVFGKPLDTVGVYDIRGIYDHGLGEGSKRWGGKLYPAYLDSDGVDCWGNTWRDANGYDRNGFNVDGRDKDGFDKDGLDSDGFNREGLDKDGVSKTDPARFAYDAAGFNAEGYNAAGYDHAGYNRDGLNAFGEKRPEVVFAFDSNGRDIDGYDVSGYNRNGEWSAEKAARYESARRHARNRNRR